MGEWKPIETAPKDGAKVDLWVRDFVIAEGGRVEASDLGRIAGAQWGQEVYHYTNPYERKEGAEGWVYPEDGLNMQLVETGGRRATAWMPLPEPPHDPV